MNRSDFILGAAACVALIGGTAAASLSLASVPASAHVTSYAPAKVEADAGAKPRFNLKDPKLVADKARFAPLEDNPALCYAALKAAGVKFTRVADESNEKGCGYDNALEIDKSVASYEADAPMPMACELAARLNVWERGVVEPAAMKRFGSPVVEIEAFGAYSCRQRADGKQLSEHAHGKAADIKAFKLADGRSIEVLANYHQESQEGAFLREVHQKSCKLFDVTLGPDYNADHANHFHLDVGGEEACK